MSLHWRAALRSVAQRGSKTTCRDKANTDKIDEQQCELELLKRQGGLATFFDAISLGRDKEEAWKYLQETGSCEGL